MRDDIKAERMRKARNLVVMATHRNCRYFDTAGGTAGRGHVRDLCRAHDMLVRGPHGTSTEVLRRRE